MMRRGLFRTIQGAPSARRAIAWQAAKFALVGFVNMAVDFAVFFFALAALTSSLVAANVLAWMVAVSGSYVLNSLVTFAAESGRRLGLRAYAAFVASQVLGLAVNTTTLVICATLMPLIGAKAAAILVGFAVNFSLARFVVFGRAQARGGSPS